MDLSQYPLIWEYMQPELLLLAATVLLFFIDLFAPSRFLDKWFSAIACVLLIAVTAISCIPGTETHRPDQRMLRHETAPAPHAEVFRQLQGRAVRVYAFQCAGQQEREAQQQRRNWTDYALHLISHLPDFSSTICQNSSLMRSFRDGSPTKTTRFSSSRRNV